MHMRVLSWSCVLLLGCRVPDTSTKGTGAVREFMVPSGEVSLFTREVPTSHDDVLVMLHGGPGLSHDYLVGLEPLASGRFTVVSYDQRGAGRSTSPPSSNFGLDAQVADLEHLRERLGVKRVHLLGHSWGGLVAMAYAVAHPDHVASLLLVDSEPPTRAGTKAGMVRLGARLEALAARGLVPATLPEPQGDDCSAEGAAIFPAYVADPSRPPPSEFRLTRCSRATNEATSKAAFDHDLRPGLATLKTPTLVISGALDPFGSPWLDEIVQSMPAAKARKVEVPQSGHFPWFEAPDAFAQEVQAFWGSVLRP